MPFSGTQLWAFTVWIQELPETKRSREDRGPPSCREGSSWTPVTDLPAGLPHAQYSVVHAEVTSSCSHLTLRAVSPASVLGRATLRSRFRLNMLLFPAFPGLGLTLSSANRSFKKCIFWHFQVFGARGEMDEYAQSITLIQSLHYFSF